VFYLIIFHYFYLRTIINYQLILLLRLNILLFFITFSVTVFCQNHRKTDSLLNLLETTVEDTNRIDVLISLSRLTFKDMDLRENSINYAEQAAKISEKINDQYRLILSYDVMRNFYYRIGEYDKALDYDGKKLSVTKNLIEDFPGKRRYRYQLAVTYNNLGNVYLETGDVESSMDYYFKALRVVEELGSKLNTGQIWLSISNVHIEMARLGTELGYKLEQYDKAEQYLLKGLDLCEEADHKPTIALVYNNLGAVHNNIADILPDKDERIREYENALQYYTRSLNMNIAQGNNYRIPANYNNMGDIYYKQGLLTSDRKKADELLNKAFNNFKKSLEMRLDLDDKGGLSRCYYNIGMYYDKISEYSKAIENMEHSLKLAKEVNSPKLIIDAAELMSDIYAKLDNKEESYKYYRIYSSYKDSIRDKNIVEIETRYENEKKAKEIEMLNMEKELKESELQRQRIWNIFIIAVSFLAVASLIIYIMQYRRKLRAYREIVRKDVELARSERRMQESFEQKEAAKPEAVNFSKEMPESNDKKESRYADSPLTESKKQEIANSIIYALEKEKLYFMQDLSLEKFAGEVGINRAYVSQVINEKFNKNFSNLINEYRIKESRRLLLEDEFRGYTMEYLANTVGFNSTTSFNKAFKKFVGVTPSYYIKSARREISR